MAASTGPVRITAAEAARVRLRPATDAVVTGGLWAERRRVNRDVSIPAGWQRLHDAGNFFDLELASGRASGEYVSELPFLDSDVYKWIEAVGWVSADPDLDPGIAERLRAQLVETEQLLRAAQQPDGYLDSHFQVRFPGERFVQLAWGHELYCAGHLIQAAIAVRRGSGDDGLLGVARRVADLVVTSFGSGPGQVDGICGHPEIETALVELYRETGEESYLGTARYFIDRRGHGLLGDGRFGRRYWQDHAPVRQVEAVTGHAVRQLYLLAGVADLAVADDDATLRDAAERLWSEMAARQTYLTGGIGAHHADEAFGDPYELPNERSYCETCAAIASIMFSWRMIMITGEARYADLLERTLYNGFLAGLSLDGQGYIYANPLQVRDDHTHTGSDGDYERKPWFRCACCPPNVMRLLASLQHYVLLADDHRAALHQYVPGRYTGAELSLEVDTEYPWRGDVTVTVAAAPAGRRTLALRIPDWAGPIAVTVNGVIDDSPAVAGWWSTERSWVPGDTVRLSLSLVPRFTRADPRVDAARGTVAVEYGPLVYCLEGCDHPDRRLDDVVADPGVGPLLGTAAGDLGGALTIRLSGRVRERSASAGWPYRPVAEPTLGASEPFELTAVPYYTWGNRRPGAMRVWIPTA